MNQVASSLPTGKEYHNQMAEVTKRFEKELMDAEKRKKFFEGYSPHYYFKRKVKT